VTEETRWLDAAQQRSWRGLVIGMTLLADRLDDDLRREFDLSLAEYEILVRLSESDGVLRMAQLASSLGHSRSRVTHTVARMEKAGLVVRRTSKADGRGVDAVLTDAGMDLLRRAAPVHVDGVLANLVDLASADDFAALGRVMNDVTDHLIGNRPDLDIR